VAWVEHHPAPVPRRHTRPFSWHTGCVHAAGAEHQEIADLDLGVSVLESGDNQANLINLTDDGCGSTCSGACATDVA
jgi:FxLD family lantipeptide